MKGFAAKDFTVGQLNAVVKELIKQGGPDAVKRFIQGDLRVVQPPKPWREEGGRVYFSVTSDGTNGAGWAERLTKKGYELEEGVIKHLLSKDFTPTSGVTSDIVVVRNGAWLNDLHGYKRDVANALMTIEHGWMIPNLEIACLIRDKFDGGEIYDGMGFRFIDIMHGPIDKDKGVQFYNVPGFDECDHSFLEAWYFMETGLDFNDGLAFVLSSDS